jgi:hypothetical protein
MKYQHDPTHPLPWHGLSEPQSPQLTPSAGEYHRLRKNVVTPAKYIFAGVKKHQFSAPTRVIL